jgi:hypothetical protein
MARTQRLVAGLIVGGTVLAVGVPGAAAAGSAAYFTQLSGAPADLHGGAVAAPLPNGEVLIAGGVGDSDNVLQSAELFDPLSEAFSALPEDPGSELTTPRVGAVAASLPNGEVLIAGGADAGFTTLQSAELFSPVTDRFTPLVAAGHTELQVARDDAVAAPLPNGDVLIAGGQAETGCQPSAELFNPSNDTFSELPASGLTELKSCVPSATAAPLPSGNVLIVGGGSPAELFHPSNNTFTTLSSGGSVPAQATAAPLPDGQVLIAGGAGSTQNAELFNPATNAFISLPASGNSELQTGRRLAVSAPLPSGDILVSGGLASNEYDTYTAELYVTAAEAAVSGGGFGDQTVGDPSAEQSLVVTNVGAQTLRIAGAAIGSGPDPGDFAITGDVCAGKALAFGHSCTITVRFLPSAVGARSATITLEDNETTPANAALSGAGVPANAGPPGSTGATGAAGGTGPRGPAGQPGEIQLVTCKTVTVVKHHEKVKGQRCTTKTITGTASFTADAARATLRRGPVTYAMGTASTTRLILHTVRAVRPGRYTLVLTRTLGRRRVTTQQPITIT